MTTWIHNIGHASMGYLNGWVIVVSFPDLSNKAFENTRFHLSYINNILFYCAVSYNVVKRNH